MVISGDKETRFSWSVKERLILQQSHAKLNVFVADVARNCERILGACLTTLTRTLSCGVSFEISMDSCKGDQVPWIILKRKTR